MNPGVVTMVVLVGLAVVAAGVRRAWLMGWSASPRVPTPVKQIHPAVADFLVNRGEVSPALAQTAALAMSRSNRRLRVQERDGVPVLRLRDETEGEPPLSPYEELVYQRVRQRMGDRLGYLRLRLWAPVTAGPTAGGASRLARRWWTRPPRWA